MPGLRTQAVVEVLDTPALSSGPIPSSAQSRGKYIGKAWSQKYPRTNRNL